LQIGATVFGPSPLFLLNSVVPAVVFQNRRLRRIIDLVTVTIVFASDAVDVAKVRRIIASRLRKFNAPQDAERFVPKMLAG
jgi:uncharacterized RDD family membrane protein YckC